MANYYCKNCGKSFTSIKYLTREKCIRNPLGTYKGYHELYIYAAKNPHACVWDDSNFFILTNN